MDKRDILQIQIRTMENELNNIESQIASNEAKVDDGTASTGNAIADQALQQQAVVGKNALAQLLRCRQTREGKLAAYQAQLDAMVTSPPAASAVDVS